MPTGAGESRQLTHDCRQLQREFAGCRTASACWPSGIEAGHGARDYLIDLSSGDSKPITPEGVSGVRLSPDDSSTAVLGPDGKWGIWPLDGGGIRPIPGLDSSYYVPGWSPDGRSVYAISTRRGDKAAKVYQVNPGTGKMELWRTFGAEVAAAGAGIGAPSFERRDGLRIRLRANLVECVRGHWTEVGLPSKRTSMQIAATHGSHPPPRAL